MKTKKEKQPQSIEKSVEKSSNRLKKLANKHQMTYTWINFCVLMIVFIGIALTLFGITQLEYKTDVDNTIYDAANKMLSGKEMYEEGSPKLPINVHILYYDKHGDLVEGYGNSSNIMPYAKEIGVLGKYYDVVLSNYKFRCLTVRAEGGYYIKCLVNIDSQIVAIKRLSNTLGLYTPIGGFCLFIVSLILAYAQIKPYQKALDSSLTFTSNVAHELNTPLSILKANMENMFIDDVDGEFSGQLSTCLSEIERLKRMTQQLLLLSRSDNKRMVYILKNYNIKKLITDICEPYSIIAEEQEKEFNIYMGGAIDSEQLIDKDMFYQIMIALLDNAIKYTKAGETINVHARVLRNKFFLTVSDTGAGVKNSDLEKIFVRFYRSEESRTTQGSGLGLPIVHAIVTSLGGKIMANNLAPKGFAVNLSFPLKQKDEMKDEQTGQDKG